MAPPVGRRDGSQALRQGWQHSACIAGNENAVVLRLDTQRTLAHNLHCRLTRRFRRCRLPTSLKQRDHRHPDRLPRARAADQSLRFSTWRRCLKGAVEDSMLADGSRRIRWTLKPQARFESDQARCGGIKSPKGCRNSPKNGTAPVPQIVKPDIGQTGLGTDLPPEPFQPGYFGGPFPLPAAACPMPAVPMATGTGWKVEREKSIVGHCGRAVFVRGKAGHFRSKCARSSLRREDLK